MLDQCKRAAGICGEKFEHDAYPPSWTDFPSPGKTTLSDIRFPLYLYAKFIKLIAQCIGSIFSEATRASKAFRLGVKSESFIWLKRRRASSLYASIVWRSVLAS